MKQSVVDISFHALKREEIENTYGGSSTRIYYIENGVLKWKEVIN